MLYMRLARPILNLSRLIPMVRIVIPRIELVITPQKCSTRTRIFGRLQNAENYREYAEKGFMGQSFEAYDGMNSGVSNVCLAQAWSDGIIIRVYEAIEKISREERDSE